MALPLTKTEAEEGERVEGVEFEVSKEHPGRSF